MSLLNVRRSFDDDETLAPEVITNFREVFLGAIHGVLLFERGRNDPHVVFEIISEDDGHWFYDAGVCGSVFWLPSLIELLKQVHQWCEENCTKVKEGWEFK